MVFLKIFRSLAKTTNSFSRNFKTANSVMKSPLMKPNVCFKPKQTLFGATMATTVVIAVTPESSPIPKSDPIRTIQHYDAFDRCNKELHPEICKDVVNYISEIKQLVESDNADEKITIDEWKKQFQMKVNDTAPIYNKCLLMEGNNQYICDKLFGRAFAIAIYSFNGVTVGTGGVEFQMKITDLDILNGCISGESTPYIKTEFGNTMRP